MEEQAQTEDVMHKVMDEYGNPLKKGIYRHFKAGFYQTVYVDDPTPKVGVKDNPSQGQIQVRQEKLIGKLLILATYPFLDRCGECRYEVIEEDGIKKIDISPLERDVMIESIRIMEENLRKTVKWKEYEINFWKEKLGK